MYPDPDPVRIQVNKITKLISKLLFRSKKKISSLNLNLRDKLLFFRLRLEKYNFLQKKKKKLLVKLCFSLHFIPPDPDPDPRT